MVLSLILLNSLSRAACAILARLTANATASDYSAALPVSALRKVAYYVSA